MGYVDININVLYVYYICILATQFTLTLKNEIQNKEAHDNW